MPTDYTYDIIRYVWLGMVSDTAHLRSGQCLFNAIKMVRPRLAQMVVDAGHDPFYQDEAVPRCLEYLKFVIDAGI